LVKPRRRCRLLVFGHGVGVGAWPALLAQGFFGGRHRVVAGQQVEVLAAGGFTQALASFGVGGSTGRVWTMPWIELY
jgi:hypothetical protein